MRAVVFEGEGLVRVAEVPDPAILRPRDAIVRVTRAGVCGSDLHFFHLKAPIDPGEVMGHEGVGVVEAVGEEVTSVAPGDRVVVAFHAACGECWFCRRGETALCEDFRNFGAGAFSGGLAGTQAELVRVPVADVNLLPIPEEVEDDAAIFVGDVLTTGVYAAALAAPEPDDVVAVVGAGPVGVCTVLALKAAAAGRVIALDREADRLALAAAAGAEPVHVDERNPEMALSAITGDRGADVVVEAVGHPAAFATALDVVRRGGRIVVVGMYAGETTELQLGIWWARALTVRFAGVCPVHAYWHRAMEGLARGSLDPRPLISHRLPLARAQEAFELFDARRATKVLLTP
ncbi:MAG TPA: alcohol dehydrogenase catalytic domain-containing protein [Actinomycetota bacterium]